MIRKLGKCLDAFFFGSAVQLCSANDRVGKQIIECTADRLARNPCLRHTQETLQRALDKSIESIGQIEQKAVNALRGTVMTVAILGATFGFLEIKSGPSNSDMNFMNSRTITIFLLAIAMSYLLCSGLSAIKALKVGKIWYMGLENYEPVEPTSSNRAINQLLCIKQNQLEHTLRTNYVSLSFSLLRNGLIAALSLVWILFFWKVLF